MSARTNHIKIGMFVLAALFLLIAGLLAFGARSYLSPKAKFETAIPGEVSGLSVGSAVQFRGVPLGTVTRITFSWTVYPKSKSGYIVVEFEAAADVVPLPPGTDRTTAIKDAVSRGLRAMVKGQGITGTSILALEDLDPKDNPPPVLDYTPRYTYIPSAPAQFTRMLDAVEKSLNNLEKLDFGSIGRSVTNALSAVTQLSAKIDKLDFQSVATNASSLLVDLKATSVKLQDAVVQVQETIKGMKLDAVSQNANDLVTGLRDTNAKVQALLDRVTAAPIAPAVAELQEALRNLNSVLVELKRYPSGFFLGEPPLPARSVQTPRH
jgi:phospholipid/cholesterol/gamma-HCH transport system substrate-binding protein